MNNIFSFGGWVKSRRRALGLTQVELAKQVFCAAITIRKIESDQLHPSRELAQLIVNVLNVDLTQQYEVVTWARRTHPAERVPAAALMAESAHEIQGFASE